MIRPDDIKVQQHFIRWNDQSTRKPPRLVQIAFIETQEQANALDLGLNGADWDNPVPDKDWLEFDENIFFYIYEYMGEKIDDYYKNTDNRNEFTIIGDDND